MPSDEPFTASKAEVRQLIHRLIGLQDKWPSEPTLAHLSPCMINGLLVYHDRLERERSINWAILGILWGPCLISWVIFPGFPSWSFAITPLFLTWMYRNDLFRHDRSAVYALTQINDRRALPTLIKAIENKWGRDPEILNAIRRLLEQVTEEDAGLLSQQVQNKLWKLALLPARRGPQYDKALAINALQAFACIGSRETLVRMHDFARLPDIYPAHRRLNGFIEQLLPTMESRLQRQEVPQTLLRASDASSAPPDTLLRAAYTSTPEPPQHLLRASTSENSESDL